MVDEDKITLIKRFNIFEEDTQILHRKSLMSKMKMLKAFSYDECIQTK